MSCADCSGLCQSKSIMAILTQVSLAMEQVNHDLADRHIRLALLEERLDAHSVWLERLNKECRHLMRYTTLPTEE